jgi:glycosyltransferase involved in cell wall biosynthesis
MQHRQRPTVSIGLPVYNGADYLRQAVDSILSQSHEDFELIISDNASTDDTPSLCQEYASRDSRVTFVRNESNLGAAPNFNRAFELASGPYFMWAAHDDVYRPEFLERCLAVLEGDPSSVLCFSMTRFIDDAGRHLKDYSYPLPTDSTDIAQRFSALIAAEHIVVEIFGLIRREILATTPLIGSYVYSDIVLLAELALHGRFVQVPEPLFLHREHQRRSARVHRDHGDYTVWYDTSKSGRFAAPNTRRLFAHGRSLFRVSLPVGLRARLLREILRVANWRRRGLLRDLVSLLRVR